MATGEPPLAGRLMPPPEMATSESVALMPWVSPPALTVSVDPLVSVQASTALPLVTSACWLSRLPATTPVMGEAANASSRPRASGRSDSARAAEWRMVSPLDGKRMDCALR
ncbi:hypothetical protein D3C73_1283280 [compost metagenome]